MLCLVCVCPNYSLLPVPLPSPPDAVLLGIISFGVVLQQGGDEGGKVGTMDNNSECQNIICLSQLLKL
jgi:xanthosine utilization system XapX-like protein